MDDLAGFSEEHIIFLKILPTPGGISRCFDLCIWGGSSHATCNSKARKQRDKEWEEIGDKVELKVMRKLKEWAEED